MSQPEPVAIPGARMLLEQMVRLNDIQIEAVGHLRQKSRAYLSVGALAVAAGIALLAIPDAEGGIHFGVVGGVALALALFGTSAVLAVRAERATPIPDAPGLASLASLMADQDHTWSNDHWRFGSRWNTGIPSCLRPITRLTASRASWTGSFSASSSKRACWG